MKFIQRSFKFTGLKKPQDFIIYPCLANAPTIMLQSDTRILVVSVSDSTAIMSAHKANGAYSPDLSLERGAKKISLNAEQIAQVLEMRDKMANKTATVTLIG